MSQYSDLFSARMDKASLDKLHALRNPKLESFVADAIELCQPAKVVVFDDSEADIKRIRQIALETREETPLATPGHTLHFDSSSDLARDPKATKYLLPPGMTLGKGLSAMGREEGLGEIRGYLKGSMKDRTMIVCFLSLGPTNSVFSIPCVQITDSSYVAHSETLLYRPGYAQFQRMSGSGDFFRFLHSAGRVGPDLTSIDHDKRRIYIDVAEDMVYTVNTQYAGNTVGLKKLALRLAIRKADREGWLAEHMFLMGVKGPHGRKSYFSGAYPSACGKTSTAMIPGETIIGDDLAYLRVMGGVIRAANVEKGIFGIIEDVNSKDDPMIWNVLNKPGEVIFSNVLVKDDKPYWAGMAAPTPKEGRNSHGQWHEGDKDANGKVIPISDKNSRYTISLSYLDNLDEQASNPQGVAVDAILYGGRDSDTWVPVQESFNWSHGVICYGACLESESTAATVGATGVRTFDMMSILQFLAIPLGKYLQNNLSFGQKASKPPRVFGTNYFLKDKEGKYLNGKLDKSVWVKWAELRVHGDVDVIQGPTGCLPKYEDLARLFKQVLNKEYTKDQYVEQFKLRIPANIAKIDRIEKVYREISDTPAEVFKSLAAQKQRLIDLQKSKGDYVSPLDL